MAKRAMKTSSAKSGGKSNSNLVAAIAYLFGWISGIIVYLVKPNDSFARFHAVQSMIWSLLLGVVSLVLSITVVGLILVPIVWIVGGVSWLWLMYKAYTGERYHLPFVGEWAEKYS